MSETNGPYSVNPEIVRAIYGEPETKTVKDRIEEDGIRILDAEEVEPSPTWPDATAWRVTLTHDGESMTLTYHKGPGHNGAEPTVEEVLEALLLDASGVENADDFEEWAGDHGYNPDSRQDERLYKDVLLQTRDLERLLGEKYEDYRLRTDF